MGDIHPSQNSSHSATRPTGPGTPDRETGISLSEISPRPPSGPANQQESPLPPHGLQPPPIEPAAGVAPPNLSEGSWSRTIGYVVTSAISIATNAVIDLTLAACIGPKNLEVFEKFIKKLQDHSKDESIKVTNKNAVYNYLKESFKDPEKFKAVLKSLFSPDVIEMWGTLEPILNNTADGIQKLNASVGHIIPDPMVTKLTQHNQINHVLAQMKDHPRMFTTMAEAIRRASPDIDAFLDALGDTAFFCRDRLLGPDASLFDLRDFLNNHPPSNLAIDLTPIQELFNEDEDTRTILNHIKILLANNLALYAIEEITQELPFLTDIQQKKIALTFAMVPLLSAINESVSNSHFPDIQSIQTAVVALTDVRTPQEFNNWKTQHAPAILTLHEMLNDNTELKAATMECLNRAANHPRLGEHAPYFNIVKDVISLPSIESASNELASAVFELAELMAKRTLTLNTAMALFNPSLLNDLKGFAKKTTDFTQTSTILDTAITKEIDIIKDITQQNDTIASALTEFHTQQNKETYHKLKQALDTFFEEKIQPGPNRNELKNTLTKKNEAFTALNQLEKYAQAKALVGAMSNPLNPQHTPANPELTLLLEAHNLWTKPEKFSNGETITGLSSRFVKGISSVKNTANTIVKNRLEFFNDLFKFDGPPEDESTNDIEQQLLGFLNSPELNLQSFNEFFSNHKENFKKQYGLTDDLSTKAAMFNLLCAKATPAQRDSLLVIAKEMEYVDQIHIFHICTFPNINPNYQRNAANYFENHMFCTSPKPSSSTARRNYPNINPITNEQLVSLIKAATHTPDVAGHYLVNWQTDNLTDEHRQELLQFFKQKGSNWVSQMVSNQPPKNINDLKSKLETLGIVFFNPPNTTDKIIDGIRDPLIEHIINDLTQTLPRFIATQDNKDGLLTCLNDVLTNIFSSDSPNQTRTESIKASLTELLESVETKIEELNPNKASNHKRISAETHPLKSLKRTLDILSQLDEQAFEQVYYLIENIFNAKIY